MKKKVILSEVTLGNLKFQKRPPIIKNFIVMSKFFIVWACVYARTTRKKAFIASALRSLGDSMLFFNDLDSMNKKSSEILKQDSDKMIKECVKVFLAN